MKAFLAAAVALALVSSTTVSADPIKNIVLVHGAWVDASGWKPVYEILTKQGFHVTVVQEPETSFADDVTATKRILDLQDGPTILVGHSYGGTKADLLPPFEPSSMSVTDLSVMAISPISFCQGC
jgi:pimeloyl-ACP methyl ester carboxylesterase